MNRYYLSIGSNINPNLYVPACVKLLKEKFYLDRVSSVYETDPVGPARGGKFWNLAAVMETELSREALMQKLHDIEHQLGRERIGSDKYAPRTIDIDLLPQKDYQKFAFIMIPLAEIDPDKIDEETGQTFRSLAESLHPSGTALKKIRSTEEVI